MVSKLGSELLLDCLNSSASLGHRPAAILYMEGIIRYSGLERVFSLFLVKMLALNSP